ncbi:MAG: DUF167 domain-containing protein [Fibrobacter sp.]|nr:DUF167 domain-containing protein [Fibrobacter sp.]
MACTFDVRLKPKAKRNSVTLADDCVFDVSVTSAPIDNKANEHLVKLLSDVLRVPKSSIEIIKGGHSKSKAVAIATLSKDEVIAKMRSSLTPQPPRRKT